MTRDNRQFALKCLEEIQKDCLQIRFGDDFDAQFQKFQALKKKAFNIEDYFASQPSMSEHDKEQMRQQFQVEFQSTMPTKYQDIDGYSILTKLFQTIETTAKHLSLTITSQPIIGTAYSKEYNAFAAKVPTTDEHLIVFEGELFILANQLAKIVAQCLPDFKISDESVSFSFKTDRIKNHILTNKILQQRFADLVENGIRKEQATKMKQYYLQEPYGRLQWELLNSLELFVVGHEYGHIVLGHLANSSTFKCIIKQKEVEKISPSWTMEYEADLMGVTLLINTMNQESMAPFCYCGAELFFTFLDLVDRVISFFDNGKEERSEGSQSHPPPLERRERIRLALKTLLHPSHLESYQVTSEFLETVYEELWSKYKETMNAALKSSTHSLLPML